MSLELHHDFTFNPDGSGRVTVCWTSPSQTDTPSPDDFLRTEIERAQGVDTWADLHCASAGDQLVFSGTAWFRDITALRFHCQGLHISLLDFRVEPQPDASIIVTSEPIQQTAPVPTLPANATHKEAQELLAAERGKLEMARDIIATMFGSLKCRAILRLPGKLVGKVRGQRLAENAVQIDVDGQNLVGIFDRLMTDDELMLRMMRQGGVTPDAALELLGDNGPVTLRTAANATPQFDYEAEVNAVSPLFAAFAESLRAAVPVLAPAEPMANVRIVASKVVLEADSERDLCPQGESVPSVTLTIAGDLPMSSFELDDAGYQYAVTDDGTDITPSEEWDRRCHFPKGTKDGRTVYVDINLKPPAGARGLAELHGRVTCVCSEGSEELDLGFAELVAGAVGTVAGAQLLRVDQDGDGSDEPRWTFEIQLEVSRQRVLACQLLVGDDRVTLEQSGYSASSEQCSLNYSYRGALPADARLVMSFATNLSRVVYGFSLLQVDWLGRAL